MNGLIIDCFAGGGGASVGIEKTGATLGFEDMDLAKEFGFGGAEE